ncbi:MAG: biopolymer transporter ExbD [Oscillatoriales cyanobacterium C42_A2020_001]|nr:biopolymer transporter ExbD [Leptolyngbyaceae cyanobacterium C42_A2020_001]
MSYFDSQKSNSQIPEVNLVPMMDVIMTILTFFIIVSMTMTDFQSVNVPLPKTEKGATKEKIPDPMIVALNQQGQILLKNQNTTTEQLEQQIVVYLNKNPKGAVVLKADRKLSYEKVVQILGAIREVGGDRVSLAID